jgi:hypothetical protein
MRRRHLGLWGRRLVRRRRGLLRLPLGRRLLGRLDGGWVGSPGRRVSASFWWLLVLTLVVVWGRNLLLNTDRYVQTVEPLASNAGVQNTVIAAVDAQFQGRIDLKSVLDLVLLPRRGAGVGASVAGCGGFVGEYGHHRVRAKRCVQKRCGRR